jgi:hypothetical protein
MRSEQGNFLVFGPQTATFRATMKPLPTLLAVLTSVAISHAGTGAASKMATPMTEVDPFGQITIGGKFAEDLNSGYADILTGLARTQNSALFVNLRGTFADNDQDLFSAGLGYRFLLEDKGIILGVNAYYDQIESAAGNSFQQLGLGIEVLSKWIDARANYYVPESGDQVTGSFSRRSSSQSISPQFTNGNLFQRNVTNRTTTRRFNTTEQALEGWNAEVGVLLPWVEKFCEVRVFAGGYSYDNPLGGETAGFKARAEARVTQGITLDVEYWEDEQLVGGNWVGGVRVSVPFDFSELCGGRNPFAGAGNIFASRKSESLSSRMDEMVIRSHRIMTADSTPVLNTTTVTKTTKTITVGKKAVQAPVVVAPPVDNGGEGEGGGKGPGPQ